MNAIAKFETFYQNLASMKVEELPSLYSHDVIFIDPIARHKGIDAVKTYFSKLLENAKHCTFTIHLVEQTSPVKQTNEKNIAQPTYLVTWTMIFTSDRMNKGQPITVDGITHLKIKDDKIAYHRDYYDLGQMVYENIPLLGRLIKMIKRTIG